MEQLQLDVRTDERVAVVTLDDPERRNALNATMVAEIVEVFDQLEADDGVGAVVVTGAAPAFCAGANLGNLAEATRESLTDIYEGFLRVARSTLPTVAAVNGAAVGAGMNLALVCDVRLAAERARFDTRFVDLGLHPGGGTPGCCATRSAPVGSRSGALRPDPRRACRRAGWPGLALLRGRRPPRRGGVARSSGSIRPKPLVAEIKRTLTDMAGIDTHPMAVDRELDTQVWSTRQPFFAERLAAFQARISKRT
jgi:enoyl-CoA hydratase